MPDFAAAKCSRRPTSFAGRFRSGRGLERVHRMMRPGGNIWTVWSNCRFAIAG